MAVFSNDNVQNLTQGFDKLGFNLKVIDQNNESRWTNDEVYKDSPFYTKNPSLVYKMLKPIVVENYDTGNVYNVYWRRQWANISNFASYSKEYMSVDENGNLSVNENFTDGWYVELAEKGKKQVDGEDIDIEEYKSTSEFAKFDDFDSVDAPNYSNIFVDDPQLSVVTPDFDINALTDSQIKKAEQKLKDSVAKWEQLKSVKADELQTAMWTFDEIDEIYNAGITEDDKRAYFLYLQNKTRKKLKGDWDKKYGCSYPAEAGYILGLMKRGALFYDPSAKFGERLQPKVIYESGNIWKKYGRLTSQKEEIIQRFGEELYEKHLTTLNPIYQHLTKNRLSVRSEDKSMRLFMSPISKMAEEIKIKEFFNPKDKTAIERNLNAYTTIKDGQVVIDTSIKYGDYDYPEKTISQMLQRLKSKFGKNPNDYKGFTAEQLKNVLQYVLGDYNWFEGKNYAESKFTQKSVFSLKEGFIRWCREAGEGLEAQKNGIQFGQQIRNIKMLSDYYLNPLQKNPFSNEGNGKDTFNRYKNEAKKVGERLFAQFLAESLNVNDQLRVETIWNSEFNAYVDPDLSKVPIGFTYKKYLDGDTLFQLSEFNLRAIKYYLTRGSAGLAYGVGVGKTFCSIFVIKQALDLGLATRPLIIVPNQVYQQFKFEVFRALGSEFNDALPDSRVNGFFNGMEESNTIKGNNAVDGINMCTYKATELFAFDEEYLDPQWLQESCLIIDSAPTLEEEKLVNSSIDSYAEIIFNIKTQQKVDDVDADKSSKTEDEVAEETNYDIDVDSSLTEDEDFDMGDTFAKGGGVSKPKPMIYINTPQTNYDMVVVDEVHNFNNLFEKVEMEIKEEQGGDRIARDKNPFSSIRETGGESSARAKKLWFVARYVQKLNKMGNTILLSATPFTNSPLQVYSLMSMLNWEYLNDNDMGVIGSFFLNYAKTDYTEDFKTDLSITRRTKLIGWNNVVSLQKYIFRYFDKSTREDEDKLVVRPNKWALPLKRLMVDGAVVEFSKDNYISTTIRMSDLQNEIWGRIRDYAKPINGLDYSDLCSEEWQNTTRWGRYEPPVRNNNEDEVDVENADDLADGSEEGDKVKNSVKAITCLQWGRQVANNPYVYKCSGFKDDPTPTEYVEQSPKMLYVMECIRSVKEWHESQTDPQLKKVSGQVIYMDFQPKAFVMYRDYLIENLGYTIDEIGIISGSGNFIGKKSYSDKQVVADAFLGRVLNKQNKYINLPEEKRVKVLIGSSAIKEGINLQKYGSVLYNCYLDFNPTDRIQVEGRIWRQGNLFNNVRIVTPLMADSIDIFIFQKLEDKTERINQLWTRNGNVNELDTTAFDPSELKYELLSDPVQIAHLEAENKKEKLIQEKIEKNEVLSQYITLEKVFEKANAIKSKPISTWENDMRLHLYYNLSIIRPDLIELPLLNQEGYEKFAKAWFTSEKMRSNGYSIDDFTLAEYPNIYSLYRKFGNWWEGDFAINKYEDSPLRAMYLNGLFNYTIEDLINLMVQTLKDQKIAFPLGYSKNWRDLMEEEPLPIIEGDVIEFETRKGRKKGIAENVMNSYGNNILALFYEQEVQDYIEDNTYAEYFKESFKKAGVTKTTINKQKDWEMLTDADKKDLIALLKYWYRNDTKNFVLNEDRTIRIDFNPVKLDSDDFEDLNIREKEIVKIEKEVAKKKVEPTKYPEPFTYSNKERDAYILDIMEYNVKVQVPKKPYIQSSDLSAFNEIFGDKDRTKFMPLFTDRFSTLSDILLSQQNSSQPYYLMNQINSLTSLMEDKKSYFPNTWAELMANWQDKNGGLYKTTYTQIYDSSYALILSEFKQSYEKKMLPLGITKITDVNILVSEQRAVINAIDIEINNLGKEEVMQELIAMVRDTQAKLASDEIRAGSSFKARAGLFANTNSDYLGNAMLGLQNKPKDDGEKPVEVVIEPIIEEEEEEVILEEPQLETEEFSDAEIKRQTLELISQLKPALKLYEGAEKEEFKEYLDSLKSLVKQLG
jgi:hypothetical protein